LPPFHEHPAVGGGRIRSVDGKGPVLLMLEGVEALGSLFDTPDQSGKEPR
jgi:hypothetical protein